MTQKSQSAAPLHRQSAAPLHRVVVGVDDTPAGVTALDWAMSHASRAGAELVAVRAWHLGLPRHGGRRRRGARWTHPRVVLDFDGTQQRAASAELVRRSLRMMTPGARRDRAVVTIMTPEGEPGSVLRRIASRPGDVLVVGHDPALTLKRAVHGSVSGYCQAHARCPVYVVPARNANYLG